VPTTYAIRTTRTSWLSFGLYDGSLEDPDRIRSGHGDDEGRLARIDEHVEETLVEGVFEVVEEVDPHA
jgi:hypothetical protein